MVLELLLSENQVGFGINSKKKITNSQKFEKFNLVESSKMAPQDLEEVICHLLNRVIFENFLSGRNMLKNSVYLFREYSPFNWAIIFNQYKTVKKNSEESEK